MEHPSPAPGSSMQSFGKSFLAGITRLGNLDDITGCDNLHGRFLRVWFDNNFTQPPFLSFIFKPSKNINDQGHHS